MHPSLIYLSLLFLSICVAQENGTTVLVYGIRPRGVYGISDKNTADDAGDAYFLLSRLATTYQTCLIEPDTFDCNCEITCKDNVITSYNLTYYTPLVGYRNCNPVAGSTIQNYTYYCDNPGDDYDVGADCPADFPWYHSDTIPDYLNIWRHKLGVQLGGTWYSTPAEGQCPQGDHGYNCAWESVRIKVIDKFCMTGHYTRHAYFKDPVCFEDCPNAPYKPDFAYYEDACWNECFVDTIFQTPRETLVATWRKAFNSDDVDKGGCPPTLP